MMLALLALPCAGAPSVGDGDTAGHVASSLEPEGELLGAELVDLEGDGTYEVCLALRLPDDSRQLALHRLGRHGADPVPFRVVPVLDDALAYGFADVRSEPGRELFFLTEGGAWSYSLEHDGYRGNVRRLVSEPLLYDFPDPAGLDAWRYVLERGGGDWILLPGDEAYSVWGPAPDGGAGDAAEYAPIARFPVDQEGGSSALEELEEHTVQIGSGGIRVTHEAASGETFLNGADGPADVFLSSRRGYRAPALVDVDGDGARDLVALTPDELVVHWNAGEGSDGAFARRPPRIEARPAYLDHDEVDLEVVDLDGDGDPDLLARTSDEVDGIGAEQVSVLALLNDGTRLFPERPDQVLRFETNDLTVFATDVDGDGRVDLALRKFELPSFLDMVTDVEFKLTFLLYLGVDGPRPFERKPVLKKAQAVDEAGLVEQLANRAIEMDCDGDGLADVVEIDTEGRVSIRRLVHDRGFFGGSTWSLEDTPWARFQTFGSIESIEVRDLNRDGLGDVISRGPKALSLLLSTPGAGRGGAR